MEEFFSSFCVARVCQHQLGFLVSLNSYCIVFCKVTISPDNLTHHPDNVRGEENSAMCVHTTDASLLSLFNENPSNLFQDLVSVDETWLHHFDPENTVQCMAWKHVTSPPSRKFHVVISARKAMSNVFWRNCTDMTIWKMAKLLQVPTTMTWLENAKRHWKRTDKENCCSLCQDMNFLNGPRTSYMVN